MGEVIRKTAAVDDIFHDVRASLVNARAKGGVWAALAEEQLGAVVGLIDTVMARHREVSLPLPPLRAAIAVKTTKPIACSGASRTRSGTT
jgi:hypothetical protein